MTPEQRERAAIIAERRMELAAIAALENIRRKELARRRRLCETPAPVTILGATIDLARARRAYWLHNAGWLRIGLRLFADWMVARRALR